MPTAEGPATRPASTVTLIPRARHPDVGPRRRGAGARLPAAPAGVLREPAGRRAPLAPGGARARGLPGMAPLALEELRVRARNAAPGARPRRRRLLSRPPGRAARREDPRAVLGSRGEARGAPVLGA